MADAVNKLKFMFKIFIKLFKCFAAPEILHSSRSKQMVVF